MATGIDIFKLERDNPDMTQLELARVLTFDFNKTLVHTVVNFWEDAGVGELFLTIINNKLLLEDRKESLATFFDRVSRMEIIGKELVETLRPFVKSGLHVTSAKTLLTSNEEFVSLNEHDYCIRITPWFIICDNEEFSSVINTDFNQKMMLVSGPFDESCIAQKGDVESFDGNTIIMKSGLRIKFYRM